jgi:hypothetical protein
MDSDRSRGKEPSICGPIARVQKGNVKTDEDLDRMQFGASRRDRVHHPVNRPANSRFKGPNLEDGETAQKQTPAGLSDRRD